MQADLTLCRVGIRELFCLERRAAIIGDSQRAVSGILDLHCHGLFMRVVCDAVQLVVLVHVFRNLFPDRIGVFTDVFQGIFDWLERRCPALLYRIAGLNDIAGCIQQFELELSLFEVGIRSLLRAELRTSDSVIVRKRTQGSLRNIITGLARFHSKFDFFVGHQGGPVCGSRLCDGVLARLKVCHFDVSTAVKSCVFAVYFCRFRIAVLNSDLNRLFDFSVFTGACDCELIGSVRQFSGGRFTVHCHVLFDLQRTGLRPCIRKYKCLILLGQLAAVGGSGLRFMFNNVAFFIKNVVGDSGREHIPFIIRQDFFDFVLRSLLEAAEHFLLTALQFEFHNAVFKLVVTIFLVIVLIDRAVVLQDGKPEIVIPVQIRLLVTFDLFFNDKSLQRPVLDLHAVGEVVNKAGVIHQ